MASREQELNKLLDQILGDGGFRSALDRAVPAPQQGFISQALMGGGTLDQSGGDSGGAVSSGFGGSLSFNHPEQRGINGNLRNALLAASAAIGKPLTINSGYRSREYNDRIRAEAKARGDKKLPAKNSLHISKLAADVSTAGMTTLQKQQLISSAIAAGAHRIGFYGNFVHIDMQPRKDVSYFNSIPAWARPVMNKVVGQPLGKTARAAAATIATSLGARLANVPVADEATSTSTPEMGLPQATITDAPIEEGSYRTGTIPTPTRAPARPDRGLKEGMTDLGISRGQIATPSRSPMTPDPARFDNPTPAPDYVALSPELQQQLSLAADPKMDAYETDTSVAPAPREAVESRSLPALSQVPQTRSIAPAPAPQTAAAPSDFDASRFAGEVGQAIGFDNSRFDGAPPDYTALSPTLNAPAPTTIATDPRVSQVAAGSMPPAEAVKPFTGSILPNRWEEEQAPAIPRDALNFPNLMMNPGFRQRVAETFRSIAPQHPADVRQQQAATTTGEDAPLGPMTQQSSSDRLSNLNWDMYDKNVPLDWYTSAPRQAREYAARQAAQVQQQAQQRDLARAVSDILGEQARDRAQSVYTASQAGLTSASPEAGGINGAANGAGRYGGSYWESNNAGLADAYKDASFDTPRAAGTMQMMPLGTLDPVYTQPQRPEGSMQMPQLGALGSVPPSLQAAPQVSNPQTAYAPTANDIAAAERYSSMSGIEPGRWSGVPEFDSLGNRVNAALGLPADAVGTFGTPSIDQLSQPNMGTFDFGQTANPVQGMIQREAQQQAPQQAASTSTPEAAAAVPSRAPTNPFTAPATSYNLDYNSLPSKGVYNGGINPETGRFEVESTGNIPGPVGNGLGTKGGLLGFFANLAGLLTRDPETASAAASAFGAAVSGALGINGGGNPFSATGPGGMFGGAQTGGGNSDISPMGGNYGGTYGGRGMIGPGDSASGRYAGDRATSSAFQPGGAFGYTSQQAARGEL